MADSRGWDRRQWWGDRWARGVGSDRNGSWTSSAAASSSQLSSSAAASRARRLEAPERYAASASTGKDAAFDAFLERPEINKFDAVRSWREEVKKCGKRNVSLWESFKNYRRACMNKMYRVLLLNKMFQRWRVYIPKCYMKVTVRDLLWTEERNDA